MNMRRIGKPLMMLMTALCVVVPAIVQAQEQQQSIILSVSHTTTRWAAVYKAKLDRADDPYFHVRVFEHRKGWEPWRFKELVFHMAVTPKALDASRIDRKAKIYSYKDVEIRGSYRRWLDDPAARAEVPVCDRDILTCIKSLPRR